MSLAVLLLLAAPSAAASAHSSSLAFHYPGDNNDYHKGNEGAGAWERLQDALGSIKRKQRHFKPSSVQLGDDITGSSTTAATSRRRRRHKKRRRAQTTTHIQVDEDYSFSVESPHPTFISTTMRPTIAPSPAPSQPSLSSAFLAPTTGQPSTQDRQMDQPPSVVLVPSASTTARPPIPDISASTKAPSAPFQALKFAEVPVGFDVLLETGSQQDLDDMAAEAKTILEEYLYRAFAQGFGSDFEEGVVVRRVDLTVLAIPTPEPDPVRQRRLAAPVEEQQTGLSRLSRFLQQELDFEELPEEVGQQQSSSRAITLESRGAAGFQVNRDAVDTQEFLNDVNTIINESVQPNALMDLFQNSSSGLSDYRVASVTNNGPVPEAVTDENDNQKDGPEWWEIIIAAVLIVLMVVSLVAYGYVFWKKRKKRLMRRKQFGVSGKTPSPYKGAPPPRGRGASVTPAKSMGANAVQSLPTKPNYPRGVGEMHSSDEESSYKGLGSASEDAGADMFAKELRLAASLDRKAWDDFHERQEQFHDEDEDGGMMMGQSPRQYTGFSQRSNGGHQYPANGSNYASGSGVYRDLSGMEAGITPMDPYGYEGEQQSPPGGAVGLTVMGDTVSLQSNSSFPYGDENDGAGPDHLPKNGIMQDPDGEAFNITPVGNLERDASNGGWRTTEAAESKLSPRRSPPKYSFLNHGSGPNNVDTEPDAPDYPPGDLNDSNGMMARYGAEMASAGAMRGSPMSQSWSTNPRASNSVGNGTTAALRGSPHSSSLNSASRGVSSVSTSLRGSPGFESAAAVNHDFESAGASEDESTMLTSDILQEVQDLKRFVKDYEEKKEGRQRRTVEGDEPDTSFDSLLETVNSLQRAVDGHPPKSNSDWKTPASNENLPSSPQRMKGRGIPNIESMPSSDNSSDDETMGSDRRLGITPFSVQNPAMIHSPMAGMTGNLYGPSRSPDSEDDDRREKEGNFGGGTFHEQTARYSNNVSPASGSLSSLRHTDAILDGSISDDVNVPSDEFTAPEERREHAMKMSSPPLRDPRTVPTRNAPPRQRSKNKGFNNIVNMFEAKEKSAIYPPNESWQYNY